MAGIGRDRLQALHSTHARSVLTRVGTLGDVKAEIGDLAYVFRADYERNLNELKKLEKKIDKQIETTRNELACLAGQHEEADKLLFRSSKTHSTKNVTAPPPLPPKATGKQSNETTPPQKQPLQQQIEEVAETP